MGASGSTTTKKVDMFSFYPRSVTIYHKDMDMSANNMSVLALDSINCIRLDKTGRARMLITSKTSMLLRVMVKKNSPIKEMPFEYRSYPRNKDPSSGDTIKLTREQQMPFAFKVPSHIGDEGQGISFAQNEVVRCSDAYWIDRMSGKSTGSHMYRIDIVDASNPGKEIFVITIPHINRDAGESKSFYDPITVDNNSPGVYYSGGMCFADLVNKMNCQ